MTDLEQRFNAFLQTRMAKFADTRLVFSDAGLALASGNGSFVLAFEMDVLASHYIPKGETNLLLCEMADALHAAALMTRQGSGYQSRH